MGELTDKFRMAEWKTFNDQAAICHLFMNGCKREEARKACYKILTETPGGDTKLLMEKLGEIESFPKDGRGPKDHAKAVKQDEPNPTEKICTDCKRKGHLKVDFWGKCSWCGRFGHKAKICKKKLPRKHKISRRIKKKRRKK